MRRFPRGQERLLRSDAARQAFVGCNFFKGVFGKIVTFSREFSLKEIRKDTRRRKPRIFSTLTHCFWTI